MQMYDAITNLANSLGTTFDVAYVYTLFFALACVGGFGFITSLSCDVCYYFLRTLRRLFCAIFRRVRRKKDEGP